MDMDERSLPTVVVLLLLFRWQSQILWRSYHDNLDEADIYEVLPQDSTVQLSNNLAR